MTLIPITGIPDTFRVPGAYAEILMAQGPASSAVGSRDVVLAMPMLAAGGSWTAATLYPIPNEQTAIDGGGVGSPIHRGVRKFLQANKTSKLWALPVAASSGAGLASATFEITYAGAPSKAGQTTVRVCDEDCTYSFTTTDTAATIAQGVRDIILNKRHLPVSAAAPAAVLTLTAKIGGISQGTAALGCIQVRTKIDPGCTTTVTASGEVGGTVAGVDGATTEAANLTTALNAIASKRVYFIAISAMDTTSYGNLHTHISTKSAPNVGMRSVGIGAYPGVLADLATMALARNYERLQLVWQQNGDNTPSEIAANMAAIRAKHEDTDPAYNFAGYSDGGDWKINGQYLTSDYPTAANQNDAINDGITPLATNGAGGSYIVMSVNTRSKTAAAGTVDDFRATETHRLSVCDHFTDRILSDWAKMYQGKKLASDELLADGTVNPNQKVIRGVIKPKQSLEPWVKSVLQEYEDKGYAQDAAASKASLRIVRCDTNSSRVECGCDLHVIDHAHQFTMRLAEVSAA